MAESPPDTLSASLPAGLQPGDMAPFYIGITNMGKLYSFEAQAGRPVALLLLDSLMTPAAQAVMAAFARAAAGIAAADIVVLTKDDPESAFTATWKKPAPFTIGTEAKTFMARCGFADEGPYVLVLDRNLKVAGVHRLQADADALVAAVRADIDTLPQETAREITCQAPALFISKVAGRDLCARLIELFDKGGHFDSGFMTVDGAGKSMLKIDHAFKRRTDHFIQPGHPVHDEIMDIFTRRIAPEIMRAFHIEVRHCERFLIGRYDESGGYFRRHRDTTGAANAHRQFAITLNLNAEAYAGGELCFPEYGPHLYRPGTGDAAIFSGALLHEAMPVTKGTRYALLGFLHNDEAEARRQAYLASVGA